MAQDFYLTAAQQRANQIEAELAAAKADLAAHKANSDGCRFSGNTRLDLLPGRNPEPINNRGLD